MDAKIYPLNRTTKSENGVTHYASILPLVKKCGELGIRVHVHPEHPNMIYSNRDAEYAFLAIVQIFLEETTAVIIWEHGTDARCIPFWKEFSINYYGRFFVTLTAHHLVTNEDQVFGDVRSVCKPPIKTELDRLGLIGLIKENYSWVMAGADDAPHDITAKHVHCGQCACGAYTAPFLLQLYAHAFGYHFSTPIGIETFINFTSRNARKLYGLPKANREISLLRQEYRIPASIQIGMTGRVEPFWAERKIHWSLVADTEVR
jgi:dihydroorotase